MLGVLRLALASCSMAARTSTLPRLRWRLSRARKAGSWARNSSGRRKVRSKKRLLTARISSPRRTQGVSVGAVAVSGVSWALAYPVML